MKKPIINLILFLPIMVVTTSCNVIDNETKNKMNIISSINKVNYLLGEEFNSDGLKIEDYKTKDIIRDYSLSLVDGYVLNEIGTYEIYASKNGYEDLYITNINVYENSSLVIASLPTKVDYKINETFSSEGLIVKDSITNSTINDYSLSITDGTVLTNVGKETITISKENYISTSFDIHIYKEDEVGDTRTLSLYSINDTHGAFTRGQKSQYSAGMAYIGDYLKKKKENDYNNTILISPGDMWQGGIESNNTKGKIMVEAMNITGFDVMAIGNHEFDWGKEYIISNSKLANFPFITSNIFYSDGSYVSDFATPSIMLNKGGVNVGIVGACREDMGSSISGSIASQFSFPDPIEYVKEESNKLRKAGADVIVLVTHDEGCEGSGNLGSNYSTKYSTLCTTNSSFNKKYVDCMFFSHDHLVKYGYDNGVPFVEGGCDGKYISNINLNLTKSSDGYALNSATVDNPIYALNACTSENKEINELKTIKYKDLIGDLNKVIYTFSNNYDKTAFTKIICQAMYWYINNNLDQFGGVKVGLTSHNTAGVRNNVESGDFTMTDLTAVCPFDNLICIQKSTSTQVNNIKKSSWLGYYEDKVTYDNNGLATVATISYVAEGEYASNYQTSFTYGGITAKEALQTYLEQLDYGVL